MVYSSFYARLSTQKNGHEQNINALARTKRNNKETTMIENDVQKRHKPCSFSLRDQMKRNLFGELLTSPFFLLILNNL